MKTPQSLQQRFSLLCVFCFALAACAGRQPVATPAAASTAGQQAPASSTEAPPPIRSEVVRFGEAPWTLEGVLSLPAGRGPFPSVVMLGGSGPVDRDATLGPNKPFRDLAEALSAAGIASLRYDKRTLTYRGNPALKVETVEQEVIVDALHALTFLRSRPEVDARSLFVLGHSLGAQLAPEVGKRDGRVAGLLLLAPSARPLAKVAIEQLEYLGALPPAQLAALKKKADAIYDGSAAPTDTFLGAPAVYFRDLHKRDAFGAARELGKPVLVLRGARDYQVVEEDFELWRKAISEVPGSTAEVLPGLNHLFITGAGKPGPQEYFQPGKVADVASERLSRFIKQVVGGRS